MTFRPYWTDTATLPPIPDVDQLPNRCDVAVIGGGITGLSTAISLAREGISVVLLEKGRIGSGASTRNAGMALIGLKLGVKDLVARYGAQRAAAYYKASIDAVDFAEAFVKQEAIHCGFQRFGALWAACTPAHYQSLVTTHALLAQTFGHATRLVPAEEMAGEIGSGAYSGGLVDPLSGGLDPAALVSGLLHAALRSGVCVVQNTGVKSHARSARSPRSLQSNEGFTLDTELGTIRAGRIVVATNATTPAHLTWWRRRIVPVGSCIIVTRKLPPALASSLLPTGRMVFDTRNYLSYYRLTPDGRLLFGGRTSFRAQADAPAAHVLQSWMTGVFPQLEGVGIDYAWTGSVGFTFDRMPHVGDRDGACYAMGYCGHGVANGLYLGNRLARWMSGREAAPPFADLTFPARPLYRKRAWFLPLAGLYYRLKDRQER